MSTEQTQIQVGSVTIDVDVKDIKNMHLGVYPPEGRVRIASPLTMDMDSIRLFAISKLSWIKKQRKKFKEQDREAPRQYVDRESHYFKGQRYLLNVIEQEGGKPEVVIRNKKYIDLYVKEGASKEEREKVLKEWYREQLYISAAPIIEKWEERIGVQLSDWRIRQMKTKWGSCNIEDKRIWLNLELAKKTLECLDYVIVHEMVHFHERHHNELYVAYIDRYMPNWREVRKDLNSVI